MAGMVKMRFLADTPVLGLFTRDNIRPDSAKENRIQRSPESPRSARGGVLPSFANSHEKGTL